MAFDRTKLEGEIRKLNYIDNSVRFAAGKPGEMKRVWVLDEAFLIDAILAALDAKNELDFED